METCDALDMMIDGAGSIFDACNRDEDCLQVSCTATTISAVFTIFPCENQTSVRVFLDIPNNPYNETLTMSESVDLGASGIININLEQTEEGITFGVRIHS